MSIETIAIIHHVHTDYGYTDHPCRAKKEHVKYLDQAIEYVLASSDYPEGARFAWTQEQTDAVRLWWAEATEEKKEKFFRAIATGRLEITGTPFNVTAFMDRDEWETAMTWLPDDLWNRCSIVSAMQIDVNGMHTPGMIIAHDRGVRNLFIGPNSYYGAPPMPAPAAFNWQLDGERQMFVWLNSSYNNGTFLFNKNWRQGPVPDYSDLRYRPPEQGDIWASDDESIREAHRLCLENIALMEGTAGPAAAAETDGFTKNRVSGGYSLKTLPVSVTNQWRVDNDPPFYPLVDFVRRWNELGLMPRLELCTVRQALDKVRAEMGGNIPLYRGQWIDWWANGNASLPVEAACKREARRALKTAKSGFFGPLDEAQQKTVREIMENICMYDEHSFSSWQSVSNPYSFHNVSQAVEKNAYVYRALDGAKCLLAERARALTEKDRNRIVAMNPTAGEMSAMIDLPLNCMRGEYRSVRCEETGEVWPIEYVDGVANFLRPSDPSEFGPENVSRTFSDRCEKQGVRFGPVNIPAMARRTLVPQAEAAEEPIIQAAAYTLETDENGWPVRLQFEGQSTPLIDGVFGEMISVHADGFSPRWTFKDIFENDDDEQRAALRKEHVYEKNAQYGEAVRRDSCGQLRFEQPVFHDSIRYGVRILTVDLIRARAALEFRMDRKSDFAPEVLFLRFDAPGESGLPWISNAGARFRPEKDQFPGSCMDLYAMDGWVHYPNRWMINSLDAALVTFGQTSVVARKKTTLGPASRMYMRLFDNLWDTNFAANSCGMMRFRFGACADVPLTESDEAAGNMSADPVVVVKMGYRR